MTALDYLKLPWAIALILRAFWEVRVPLRTVWLQPSEELEDVESFIRDRYPQEWQRYVYWESRAYRLFGFDIEREEQKETDTPA